MARVNDIRTFRRVLRVSDGKVLGVLRAAINTLRYRR